MQNLVIECLKEIGLEVVKLEILALGADRNASVYKAFSNDNCSYFVKVRNGPFPEAHKQVMSLLQSAGIKEIIPPIKSAQCKNITLLVYPFIKGKNGFEQALTDSQWVLFGKMLRQIHDIQVPEEIQKHFRRETFSSNWRAAIRTELKFFREKQDIIQQIVEQADHFRQKIEGQLFPFVLCHSDIHAGNLLFKEETFYLIDWDDPIMAPKERDLMFIGGGVGNVWNQSHEEKLFYEGYGETVINPDLITYYRLNRILEDLAEYAEILSQNEKDERLHHLFDMFEPNGVIDIALGIS